jgi:glycosyltransferase involved in cell wall biosynthesis
MAALEPSARSVLPSGIESPLSTSSEPQARPHVALVHDYLTQRGGAERVVLMLMRAFPGAPVYTSLYDPTRTFPEFSDAAPACLGINSIEFLRKRHKFALPVLARSFSNLYVDADVTVCSSSGWSHGTNTAGRKIVYCHAPAHWLYQTDQYFGFNKPSRHGRSLRGRLSHLTEMMTRMSFRAIAAPLGRWDQRAAQSADRYVTNSSVMALAIRNAYGIEAEVLSPPPALLPVGPQQPVTGLDPGFLLCVSRLMPYKNVDAVVDAIDLCPDSQLVVVGEGPEIHRLRARAGARVRFLGRVDDDVLRWLYSNASALVAASYEDFGLTPLEAASFGKPVAALRASGYLETILEGQTGLFFDRPHPEEIAATMKELLARSWSEQDMIAQASTFSQTRFIDRFRQIVVEESAKTPS